MISFQCTAFTIRKVTLEPIGASVLRLHIHYLQERAYQATFLDEHP
jgi:hypothetical protein